MKGQEISINEINYSTEYILEMWDSENLSNKVEYYVKLISENNNIYTFKKTRETREEIPLIELDMSSRIIASTYKLYQIIPDNTGRMSPMLRMSPITTTRRADSSPLSGGKKRKRKTRKSNKRFRKTRSKRHRGGRMPLSSRPHPNNNNDNSALIPDGDEEEERTQERIQERILEEQFKQGLAQVIDICLGYAMQKADPTSDYNSDSDSETSRTPISGMRDLELKNAAVCNELVYGDYNTGHTGYLQQYRDLGVIGRMTPLQKQDIYVSVYQSTMGWLAQKNSDIQRRDGIHTNAIKFYMYAVTDILSKIQTAFEIQPALQRAFGILPGRGGKGRKQRKTKRNKTKSKAKSKRRKTKRN